MWSTDALNKCGLSWIVHDFCEFPISASFKICHSKVAYQSSVSLDYLGSVKDNDERILEYLPSFFFWLRLILLMSIALNNSGVDFSEIRNVVDLIWAWWSFYMLGAPFFSCQSVQKCCSLHLLGLKLLLWYSWRLLLVGGVFN